VLRRQPVIGADDDGIAQIGQPAADLVMRGEIADDPAATMQIEYRARPGPRRANAAMERIMTGPFGPSISCCEVAATGSCSPCCVGNKVT
jgi:hypothetical protein